MRTDDANIWYHAVRTNSIEVTCNRQDFLKLAGTEPATGLVILKRRRTRQDKCNHLLRLLASAGEPGTEVQYQFCLSIEPVLIPLAGPGFLPSGSPPPGFPPSSAARGRPETRLLPARCRKGRANRRRPWLQRFFWGQELPIMSACKAGSVSYDFSVKRSNTIPVPGSPALAQDLAATAAETELSQADVIRQSLKLGLPTLRARLGKPPQRRLSLVQHFKRLKSLELPPYLDE